MAAKTVVCLSYLFALLIINIAACSAYRAAPKGPSETTPGGPGKWSANKGDLGMTEEAGSDMDQNGHDGAAFGRQGVDGSSLGASINGAGIGFGSGGGVGIGGSGGIGIGGGSGGGIGFGGSSSGGRSDQSPKPEHPTVPCLPFPPAGTNQPNPPAGTYQPYPPAGTYQPYPPACIYQPIRTPDPYMVFATMYVGGSSISDEDKMNKNGIHHVATVMSSDPDHVHDHMVMMINMEGNKNAKNAGESEPKHSQTMTSNMGSKTGLAMERIHD